MSALSTSAHLDGMPLDLLVPVVRYRVPVTAATVAGSNSAAAAALSLWNDVVGTPVDADADEEDFWEGAYRLHAAIGSGAERVWLYVDQHEPEAHLWGGTATRNVDELLSHDSTLVYGSVARRAASRDLQIRFHVDSVDWIGSEALRPFLGRRVIQCGFMEDQSDPRHVPALMTSFANEGAAEVFLKTMHKEVALKIPVSTDIDVNRTTCFDYLDWTPVRFEGDPNAFVMQDYTPMRFEYRMYLVDGVPVTAAGNIEAYTPVQAASGSPFHLEMEEHRGLSERVARPDLVDTYVDFASKVGAALKAEGVLPHVLNVDVALGPDDEPLVVEIHSGLINTGLYATDPELFVRTWIESERQRQGKRAA